MSNLASRLFLLLLTGAARLPLPVLRAAGGIIGRMVNRAGGRRFRICMTNLRLCYPEMNDKWFRRVTRESLIHEAKTLLEIPRLWHLPLKRLEALVVGTTSRELLDKALAQKKGVVIITPHFGNWEFSGLCLTGALNLHSMYRPLKSPILDRYARKGRQHTGAGLVPADRSGVRQLLQALQQGGAVGILPDHVPRHKEDGVMAPFFGVPATTSVLAARLARRQNVVVLLVQARRCKGGFHLSFYSADPRVYSPDREEAAAGLNATAVQGIVEEIPQYWWSYPRFRKRLIEPESLYD